MKLPKEFEERLKRLEKILPDKLDHCIHVFCSEEDEASYTINRGVYKGRHYIFREEGESETLFLKRVEAEVVERSPKSEIIIIPHGLCLQLSPDVSDVESQSPADIKYRERRRKLRRERIERQAAAKYPPKQAQ